MHLCRKAVGFVFLSCTMIVSVGCGSSSAHLRLVDAAPIESTLDMLLDSKNLASGVGYGSASAYASVASGSRHLQIETSGTTNVLFDQTTSLSSGTSNTVLVTNSGASVLTDNTSTPASGNISIRAINASGILGTADVYIVTAGTDINTVNPTAANVIFSSGTAYQTLAAGSYQVIFTLPGQKNAVISSSPSSFSSGQVRSVVGLDGQNGGFTTAVLSDLN